MKRSKKKRGEVEEGENVEKEKQFGGKELVAAWKNTECLLAVKNCDY